ncbi:MAG TPA: threonine/serine dehydratase [Streptosporangiaceae bacterium]|nr:threonine/serine dehydratase [Streptosporangiaceae bacterium]
MSVASQQAAASVAGSLSRRDVAEVAGLIGGYVRRTPVVTVDLADFGAAPGPLTLKLEQLQHSGSFKARGAFTNLLRREIPAAGVAAASGGNHGAAVAYAAGVLGVPARIFVPEVSSPAKISRIRSYGADLVVEGATYSDSFAISQRWIAESGALAVHAYDHPQTIQGAGTTGLELLEQAPEVTTVLAAVGGGGLLSGICVACSGPAQPTARVVGAEPEGAPTMTEALAAGRPVDAPTGSVAVDSLAPRQVGELTYEIISARARGVVLVSDEAIGDAQRLLWERLRIVAEPGGVTALAALLSGRYRPEPGEHLGVVISGANTTAVDFTA